METKFFWNNYAKKRERKKWNVLANYNNLIRIHSSPSMTSKYGGQKACIKMSDMQMTCHRKNHLQWTQWTYVHITYGNIWMYFFITENRLMPYEIWQKIYYFCLHVAYFKNPMSHIKTKNYLKFFIKIIKIKM